MRSVLSVPANPIVETDSVAGHIGFELRCAERIFISLRKSKGSDLRTPVRTVARPRRIIFSAGLDCLLFARVLGVHRATIYRWLDAGAQPPLRSGQGDPASAVD